MRVQHGGAARSDIDGARATDVVTRGEEILPGRGEPVGLMRRRQKVTRIQLTRILVLAGELGRILCEDGSVTVRVKGCHIGAEGWDRGGSIDAVPHDEEERGRPHCEEHRPVKLAAKDAHHEEDCKVHQAPQDEGVAEAGRAGRCIQQRLRDDAYLEDDPHEQ